MKHTNPRLMKVVEIENNYQKHRERLMSIQHIDSRRQPHISAVRPSPASTAYKQSRLKAELFAFKSRTDQIQHENHLLMQKIERQYNHPDTRNRTLGRSPSSSSVRSSLSARINQENSRIFFKINNAKSNYAHFRRDASSRSSVRHSAKDELMNLLVNQLGVRPSVLLPQLARKKTPSQNRTNRTAQLTHEQKVMRLHQRNVDAMRQKHSLTTAKLPS
jgi:hypothetical protein